VDADLLDIITANVEADVKPRTSWRASKEFRLHLVKELARRATVASIEKAGGKING
jgi:xanthine dehydrogenase FAD-binding subunit